MQQHSGVSDDTTARPKSSAALAVRTARPRSLLSNPLYWYGQTYTGGGACPPCAFDLDQSCDPCSVSARPFKPTKPEIGQRYRNGWYSQYNGWYREIGQRYRNGWYSRYNGWYREIGQRYRNGWYSRYNGWYREIGQRYRNRPDRSEGWPRVRL
eukprot:365357-Chlamydomonas_euryale.AAC.9